MKRKMLILGLCLFIFAGSMLYANQQKLKYNLIEVNISGENKLVDLIKLGFDVDVRYGIKKGSARLIAIQQDLEKLRELGYFYTIIYDDLEEYNRSRLHQPTERTLQIGSGSMGGYFTLEETIAFIDSLQNVHSNFMSEPIVIGQSIEDRDILAYKISDNPEINEDEPEILITGLHHAREPMSIIAPLYYSQWLLENYENSELAQYLINEREIWFVPLLNPDGYLFNQQNSPYGGGMWRKNKRDNNGNGTFEPNNDGVDLNRNYGFEWGYDDIGSSPDPTSETYRGTEAFSEPESSAIRALCIDNEFKTSLCFHTFGDLLIYGEHADGTPFEDTDLMRDFAKDMIIENGYTYGNGTETVNYATNGDSDAWLYGEQIEKPKIIAYTPEIGDENDYFWASTERIIPLAEENLFMQQYICLVAGSFVKAIDHRFEELTGDFDSAPEADETLNFFISLKNLGFDFNIENIMVELSTTDENVTVLDDQCTISEISALDTVEAEFEIYIEPGAQSGDQVLFTIHYSADNGYELSQEYEIVLGSPFIIFYDTAENGTENWDTGLGWGISDERSSEGEFSFSDSPYSNYNDLEENQFTLLSDIDLSMMNNAFLQFNTRWDFERHWDEAQVSLITDNLTQWQIEEGIHTTGGTGLGVQTLGEPVYNGFRDLAWFEENYPLLEHLYSGFKFRFSMNSDEALNEDGIYLDEIKLLCYSEELLPPVINNVLGNSENTSYNGPFEISAIAGDAQGLTGVILKYSINGGTTFSIPMEITELMHFTGEIPFIDYGNEVSYFVEITDEEANVIQSEPVAFLVTDSYPAISVAPESMSFYLTEAGEIVTETFTIGNSGLISLHYTISKQEPALIRNTPENSYKKRDTLKRDIYDILSNVTSRKSVSLISEERQRRELEVILTDENDIATIGFPDFLSLSAEVTDTHLNLEMVVEENASWANVAGIISLDADQDVNTGVFPCGLGTGTGLHEIGSEFEIVWDPGSVTGNGVVAIILDGTGNTFYGVTTIQVNGDVTSTSIPLSIFNDDMNMNLAVTIINLNTDEVDLAPESGYAVLGNPPPLYWISENPTSGVVEYNETAEVTVTVSSMYLESGIYEAEIVIASDDPLNPEVIIPVTLIFDLVDADDENIIPIQTSLSQNYPNPFNPSTTISFSLTTDIEDAEIVIYNLRGQKVKTFSLDNHPELTEGSVTWFGKNENGKQVSSGIYFYRLKAGDYVSTKKMILMK